MAELNVEPKKSNWWIWLIVALIAIALIFFMMRRNNIADSVTNSAVTIGWNAQRTALLESAC